MKRGLLAIGSAMLFYGLMFLANSKVMGEDLPVTPPVTPPDTGTVTPTPVQNTEGHSTGGVEAVAGSTSLKLMFNAHGPDAKGNVNYSNSLGEKFWGDVNLCYVQDGNEAAFAGMVSRGSVSEDYFLVEVVDNGEGSKKTSPDAVRVRLSNTEPECELSGSFPGVVTKGNLQVHE